MRRTARLATSNAAEHSRGGAPQAELAPERLVSSGHLNIAGEFAIGTRSSVLFQEYAGKTTVTVRRAYWKTTAS